MQDHSYQAGFLDTWTYLATMASQTRRIILFPDVANLPLRPPAVLARGAAALDLLSGGRVEMGLGAGAFPQGIEAMGGPTHTPRHERLVEESEKRERRKSPHFPRQVARAAGGRIPQ